MSRTHKNSHNVHRDFQNERLWTFQGYYFLFPHFRFQCRCRSLGCLQFHFYSQKLSPLPLFLVNFLLCSRSRDRKHFLHFGSLFLQSIKSFRTFLFLITPLSTPNSASPSRRVFSARGLVASSLCGNSTYSTSSAMFVTGIMRLFQSNCPRGVQNRISLEVAMLCNKSEARSLDTALERLLKTSLILGSSSLLSSSRLPLSSFSLSCSSSTKSIFLFISISTGGRQASNE